MAANYLLEIGSDEIPARYLPGAVDGFLKRATEALRAARLRFEDVKTWGTPRRLVLYVQGLSHMSADAVSLVRGPSKKVAYDVDGKPTKALMGFCRSLGIEASEVTVKDENGNEYIYGAKHEKGRPVSDVLAEVVPGVVMGLECPYPMRWGDENWRWFRPIRWVVSLYGTDIIPVVIAGRTAGRMTWGHRVLHPGEVMVPSAAGYFEAVSSSYVEIDPARRRERIVREAMRLATEAGGKPVIDDDLLSEVSSISEHPSAFIGRFDEKYLRLPVEVLMTSMRHHQRYFPILDREGAVRPAFIGVRDGDPEVGIDIVRKGNEWVLRARLEDAGFFYDQDIKGNLSDRLPLLEGVRFVRNAGSMHDKSLRMRQIAENLGKAIGLSEEEVGEASQAALLAKTDLVTAMVREFPELEGIMGGKYAESEGLASKVVEAIAQHYLPRGAKDKNPSRGAPSIVALADKLDTLAVCFTLGIEVSGSQDPLGLRRNALGVVAIVTSHGYDLTMEDLTFLPLELAKGVVKEPSPAAEFKMATFLRARLEAALIESEFPVEVVRAVLGGGETRMARAERMAGALAGLSGTEDLATLVSGWRRAGVLGKATSSRRVDETLLKDEAEVDLYRAVIERNSALLKTFETQAYEEYLRLLIEIKPYIDRCLDEVLIMAGEASLKENRLALLGLVADYWSRYADFSLLKSLVPSG